MDAANLRTRLAAALEDEHYSPETTLNTLMTVPDFKTSLLSRNSAKRSYSLYDHTLMVCKLFDRYFSDIHLPLHVGRPAFRLMLCLHDIGKPRALEAGDKGLQHAYTLQMWQQFQELLPISTTNWRLCIAMLCDDALGLYMRRKISIGESRERILRMAKKANATRSREFFDLLTIYYQVDSGGYTRSAFPDNLSEFIEKPKLEAMFAHDARGDLVHSAELGRLLFSRDAETSFTALRTTFRP